MPFKRGDFVDVTYDGRTVKAMVTLASGDGRSLFIQWGDDMLSGHCGEMPILQQDDGIYYSLMENQPVILVLKGTCLGAD